MKARYFWFEVKSLVQGVKSIEPAGLPGETGEFDETFDEAFDETGNDRSKSR